MPDSFTTIFVLSAIASLIWLGWSPSELARRVEPPNRLIMAGAIILLGSLVGARLVYVVVHWGYFQGHVPEMLAFWKGGLSGFGGALGGLTGGWVYARRRKILFWGLADAVARPVMTMSVAVWSGCWLAGCAYGIPVDWGIVRPDIFGQQAARWPATLIAACASAIGLISLPWFEKQLAGRQSGTLGAISLVWIGFFMLGVSLLRGDPTLLYGGIRQETWGAGIIFATALAALLNRITSHKGVHH